MKMNEIQAETPEREKTAEKEAVQPLIQLS